MCFIKNEGEFDKYIQYLVGRIQAESVVVSKAVQEFYKRYTEVTFSTEDPSQPPVLPLQYYLERPINRIQKYQTVIKELIRNKARNSQNCSLLEQAYAIVSALNRRAENNLHVSLIEDYPGTLEILGEPIRQGQFIVWEGAPGARMAWKGHKRQVFLFKNYLLVCKPKRDTKTDTYSYIFKNMMKLPNIDVNDLVEGDDRAFEIWHEREDSVRKYLFQARTVIIKNSWVKEICGIQQRISLPVWDPPDFEEELANCTAELGETVKLACKVTGTPKPSVAWFKDGKPVEVDPHHIIIEDPDGSCTLILDNLTGVDSGQYMCYAVSPAGNASTLGKILVQVPPRFVNKLKPAYYAEGEDAQFTCTIEGAPSPQIRWYKDGNLLTDPNKHQSFSEPRSGVIVLVIKNACKDDTGYYECELVNRLGAAKSGAQLYPQSAAALAPEKRPEQAITIEVTEQETKVPKKTIIIEETITTVVKTPRTKRRISPARPPSGYSRSPRSEFSTPEPLYVGKVRPSPHRLDPEVMQRAIPTLFVTEPEERRGAAVRGIPLEISEEEQKSKWVEVEEIIEFNVQKSAQVTRKRGSSPARSEKDESGSVYPRPGARPRRSSEDDPNANNSNNNKLVEQASSSLSQEAETSGAESKGTPIRNADERYSGMLEEESGPQEPSEKTDPPAASSPTVAIVDEPCEEAEVDTDAYFSSPEDPEVEGHAVGCETPWPDEDDSAGPMREDDLPEQSVLVEEPEDRESVDLKNRDLKILTRNGKALTLEDLEDYVPEKGETYRCDNPNSAEDKPCEIAVLQTEINKPIIGKPVLLNVGRPGVSKPKQPFFGEFEQHYPGGVFMSASRVAGMQSRGPSNISFHVRESCAAAKATSASPGAAAGISTGGPFKPTPSFCTEVQLSADNGQSSFKTEVSTRTHSYGTVGETVTLCIRKEDSSEAKKQEPTLKIPDKNETFPTPSIAGEVTTLKDDGIRECTIPIPRTKCFPDLPNIYIFGDTLGPPYMQVTIEDVQARCGEMAKFHAVIEGRPQPTVEWFKGISLLTDSNRVYQFNEGTRYSLILYNTRPEDGGVYTCIAKNAAGEVLCKAELVVQEDKKSQEAKKQSTRRKLHSFYEVKQEIGRGSFGFVKRVVHKGSRVSCAAKFLPLRSKTRDPAYREREILAKLSHDRITRLLDQFETRKTLILILELCSNEELLERLFKKNVVTEAQVKISIQQLLEGIAYLHDNQVLHLDIKPSNILMVYDDRDDIKICDFGFAQKINPAEPQYSKYGSPEFVSPEILSQSPVSTASDIWPVGVISYLSLTCKSPFAGENDRATLLNIQNGRISWDIPDFVHLSKEAKDFIRKLLQPSPQARPSAMECLSHTWFVRSLMSYKSVLVMRPIPDILEKTHQNTSLGISRHLVEESSSSSTSGSSSDNEISISPGRRQFGPTPALHLSVLEDSNYPEYQQFLDEAGRPAASRPPVGPTRQKQGAIVGDQALQGSEERMEPQKGGAEVVGSDSLQEKAGLFPPELAEPGRSPGCVPRHSVIKSTFYGQPSEGLPNVPSSPGKEHKKQLERAKRSYRKAGYSKSALSGLREPLLEQFGEEGGASDDEGTGKLWEAGVGPLMIKSASFDMAQKSPRLTFQVSSRSRSLDDYRIRATSFAKEQYIEEEEGDLMPQGSPVEVEGQSPLPEAAREELSRKTSAKDDTEKAPIAGSEEQPVSFPPSGEKQCSVLATPQQPKTLISAPKAEKGEGLRREPPFSAEMEMPVVGGKSLILTSPQSEVHPKLLAQKREIEEGQLPQMKPTSTQSKEGPSAVRSESPSSAKPDTAQGTCQSGDQWPGIPSAPGEIQQVVRAKVKKTPAALQIVPTEESQVQLHQEPSVDTETACVAFRSKDSTIPFSQGDTLPVSVPGDKKHQTSPQKPSTSSLQKSMELEGKGSVLSQVKSVPISVSEGKSQRPLHPAPGMPDKKGEGPVSTEIDPLSVPWEGSRMPLGSTGVVSSDLKKPKSVIQPQFGREKALMQSELPSAVPKGKPLQVLMPSPVKTTPTSPSGAESLHSRPPAPSEGRVVTGKGPRTLAPGSAQEKYDPFSTPREETAVTLKETIAPIDESRRKELAHLRPSLYSDPEAEALENLVEEMVCLSREMTDLAQAVSDQEGSAGRVSPPREMFYQGSPGPTGRPTTRYLVRRGKREGGIGLADPSEADIIYPGEEDIFMSKKARMSRPYGGRFADYLGEETSMACQLASSDFWDRFYYSGSQGSDRMYNRMYEIALVQIQDLSEDMPRPDSKTAKFDISEVEPAFLNLYELYDIVYSPFEFLSFRKAPEKLPHKRRFPKSERAKLAPGAKAHWHQEKKICVREDLSPGEAILKEASEEVETAGALPPVAPRLEVESTQDKTPWPIGKRSDSEGDLPAGSRQFYGVPEDSTGKRRSSLQSRLGLFKPFVRSQSMELAEQSLKKKMKESVAHFSRMLTRKTSSDEESREDSEERKAELPERTSSTGSLKKKAGFPSFTLPSLKIKEKAPSFVDDLTDQTIALGQSLTLSCRTSAHASPHIEWFKDGAAIRSTDRVLISSTLKRYQLLTILAATREDFGTYTCVATNSQGTACTSCVIRRAEAPSNPPAPDIVEILEDGVQLAWKPVELKTPGTYTVLCRKDDGEWKTLASDISDCCYTVEHLPPGMVYSFRIACVSKAGVGPYSNPTAKVKIGEPDQAAFQLEDEEGGKMTAADQPTHQTYAFQTEIKRGRFSIIKQCREKLTGNPLAAKIVPYRPEDKEAVLQEYHILRRLQHTNIGQLQGAYVSPRHLVLIMELYVGPELLNALAGRSSYSEVEVRDYLWQILSAVEYLHAQNILHLDLRSENMIITEPNLLKIVDFGNAQFYLPDQTITLEGCTDYVETMASELLSDKGAVPQTDIWAIGVTAFIMLSAEYPISSEAACDFGRLVKREKIKLNRCYAGLSGGAVSFLQSTLSSNPWRRPTASECLQSPWLQETGLDESQQATVTFSTTKLRNFLAERERKRALLCSKYGVMAV
nr:obscurin-like [Pogona vitticeps]